MSLTPIQIGYIGMGALIFLIFIRMPIGMAMLLVGAGGFAAINGVEPAVALLQNVPYETFIQYSYCVVPLFILMGNFAFKSGRNHEFVLDDGSLGAFAVDIAALELIAGLDEHIDLPLVLLVECALGAAL